MNIGNIVKTVVFEPVEEESTTEKEMAPPVEIPQEEPVRV